MNREIFWKDLERVYADQDNARFDEGKLQKLEEARMMRWLAVCIVLATLIVAGFVGLGLLHLMPYK